VSKKPKYTAEEKYEILRLSENATESLQGFLTKHSLSKHAFYVWKYNYSKYGIDGLKDSRTWKKYSKELKELAIRDYISGGFSLREVVNKYEITGKSVLQKWVNKYNSHREIKATAKGMSQSMTNGRVTSWKERIEIALYCIAYNNDYQNASECYQVSYQQVYQWVKKYEFGGEIALKDSRGRKKVEDELTSEDKSKLSIKKLEVENERLRAENAFLKKLEELERRRY